MKKSIGSVFLVFVFITISLSCAVVSAPISPTPTFTSVPPTFTPESTPTSSQPIEGIDTPIIISWSGNVVTMKLYSVTISETALKINDVVLTPGSGQAILIAHAYYTGDVIALFKTLDKGSGFSIFDNKTGFVQQYGWEQYQTKNNTIDIAFIVYTKESAKPYILYINYLQEWFIDLTPLIGK